MGCGMSKGPRSDLEASGNLDDGADNPLRPQYPLLFTVKEEMSDMEQSRVPSKRVSIKIGPDI